MDHIFTPNTLAVLIVSFIIPVIFHFIGLQTQKGIDSCSIDKSNCTFRLGAWLGWLYGSLACGLPLSIVIYMCGHDSWRGYAIVALVIGLLGAGGLAEFYRTSVTIRESKVIYQGLFRHIEFDLSDIRSASIDGLYIFVDIGSRRLVFQSTLKNAGTLVMILNRAMLRSACKDVNDK